MRIPHPKTLVKAITGVTLIGLTGTIYARSVIKNRIREQDFYREAFKMLRSHEGAVKYLGEPIKEHWKGFDLSDSEHNYVQPDKVSLEISIKGPKDTGKYYFWAECKNNVWNIERAELQINSLPDNRLVIKKPE